VDGIATFQDVRDTAASDGLGDDNRARDGRVWHSQKICAGSWASMVSVDNALRVLIMTEGGDTLRQGSP
jgi:hypothetical protein